MASQVYKAAKRRRQKKLKAKQMQTNYWVSPQTYGKLQKQHLQLQLKNNRCEKLTIKQKKQIDRLQAFLKESDLACEQAYGDSLKRFDAYEQELQEAQDEIEQLKAFLTESDLACEQAHDCSLKRYEKYEQQLEEAEDEIEQLKQEINELKQPNNT